MRMERWTLDRSFKGLCDSDVDNPYPLRAIPRPPGVGLRYT